MLKTITTFVAIAITALILAFASGTPNAEAASGCKSGFKFFAGVGCVKPKVAQQAKTICNRIGLQWKTCLCGDKTIFACEPNAAPEGDAEAEAEKPACKKREQMVPGWGCVTNAEVAKAKVICSELEPPSKFTGCLCEDGGVVGACGD
jgi:hypothetical protein